MSLELEKGKQVLSVDLFSSSLDALVSKASNVERLIALLVKKVMLRQTRGRQRELDCLVEQEVLKTRKPTTKRHK